VSNILDSISRSAEEQKELRRRCDELSEYARENWQDPTWRTEMAQALTDAVYLGFTTENILDILSTVERVGENDRIVLKEARGLRAFWTAKGAWIEESRLTQEVTELPRRTIGYHVYELQDKLRLNFADTQGTLIDLGAARLSAEINLKVLRAFQRAIPFGSPYYVQGAGLSLPALDAAINAVYDETLDGNVTIIGRRTMVGQIGDQITAGGYGGFLPETNEELLRRGVLGSYKGATLAVLKNYRDDQNISFFPGNELYVVARDASKFGFWGGPQTMEWVDHTWYWHYQTRQDFGGGVFRPERLRRIVDLNQAP
jgi:hypothetical protein